MDSPSFQANGPFLYESLSYPYSNQAWQDMLLNPHPRPHIAFEADANARQVLSWLRILKYHGCLPVAKEHV